MLTEGRNAASLRCIANFYFQDAILNDRFNFSREGSGCLTVNHLR